MHTHPAASMDAFIAGMPKCELHVHLEGTLEPELKFALAARNGIALPFATAGELRATYDFHDLPSFLAIYYDGMRVLRKEPDFYDLTWAYLAKAHSQNVRYSEMFFDPQAHTARGVSFDTVIRGIRRAQMDAENRLGIRSQLIMCFLRDWSAEFAMATLLESLPYKEWIIGVGLDSDEKNNPPLKFREVFQRAREEGYLLTMHCDVDQDDTTAHIRQCIEDIGVSRLDHGVNTLDDPTLIAMVAERKLGLTICPVSNAYVTGDSKARQIKRFLDLGIRATVNSDDPAYFGGYMTENLLCTQREADLTRDEVTQLMRNAFESTWLPRAAKDRFLAELETAAG
ncbi:adenosine deaminase [Telmatospirillum siberiense]|nr:adenosine deaminase [Telmatospirillum siberiense]